MATPRKKYPQKAGRKPEYKEEYLKLVYNYALLGANDSKIAEYLGVTPAAFTQWKAKFPELLKRLSQGREEADAIVAKSLFKRAKGYSYEERTFETTAITELSDTEGLNLKPGTLVKIVKKKQPPDVTAQKFWLTNKAGDAWKDKQETKLSGIVALEPITGMRVVKAKETDKKLKPKK